MRISFKLNNSQHYIKHNSMNIQETQKQEKHPTSKTA